MSHKHYVEPIFDWKSSRNNARDFKDFFMGSIYEMNEIKVLPTWRDIWKLGDKLCSAPRRHYDYDYDMKNPFIDRTLTNKPKCPILVLLAWNVKKIA